MKLMQVTGFLLFTAVNIDVFVDCYSTTACYDQNECSSGSATQTIANDAVNCLGYGACYEAQYL